MPNDDNWRKYGIAAVVVLVLNGLLVLNGNTRPAVLGSVAWFFLVARLIQEWRAGPREDDLVKEARERDKSWTDADKQRFKDLIEQRQR